MQRIRILGTCSILPRFIGYLAAMDSVLRPPELHRLINHSIGSQPSIPSVLSLLPSTLKAQSSKRPPVDDPQFTYSRSLPWNKPNRRPWALGPTGMRSNLRFPSRRSLGDVACGLLAVTSTFPVRGIRNSVIAWRTMTFRRVHRGYRLYYSTCARVWGREHTFPTRRAQASTSAMHHLQQYQMSAAEPHNEDWSDLYTIASTAKLNWSGYPGRPLPATDTS
ncbi:hypothetical protein F5Y01DRAFT_177914 [Xylaria sp. FL0043]|nr:hypothetical protein F5Y01DRAFT_177914 [Xylaria sp. FL0043]